MDDDSELVEFATRLFGLARTGETEALAGYVDAGVPVDLSNDAGADPAAGTPSAVDAARMFGHDDFLAWFEA